MLGLGKKSSIVRFLFLILGRKILPKTLRKESNTQGSLLDLGKKNPFLVLGLAK